ncbi:MAG TPA: nitrous oxide reductase family maturation protein NosD [Chitinophagaceae bacterium]|nr:nitrous oxide reductase family maturation protein NosD [Chitinophagaceae bacterium]
MKLLLKILLFCVVMLYLASVTFAATWRVGAHQNIHSIQKAIDRCRNGDTIIVDPGTYFEKNILINKSVSLIGLNYPVLDGEKKYEILSIKADDVLVDGFKLQHSGHSDMEEIAAVKIYNKRNAIIRNNILEDNFFGIYTQSAVNCLIEKNHIQSSGNAYIQNGNAIHCFRCDSMLIIANYVSGHRDGIYFEFVTNSVIWRNTSEKNIRYGLHFMISHNNAYICNKFRNNGAGVAVMYTHGVKMYNNIFEENQGAASYGLLIKEITDSYIVGNRFIHNTTGIYMEGGTRIDMQKNIFCSNGWAVKIQASCTDDVISFNNFTGNTFDIGTNGSLVLNKFNSNYWDKYEGYDLNKDGSGDVPFRPVSLYSVIVENNPSAAILFRSFIVSLLDKSEKVFPGLTPIDLEDNLPLMKPLPL